MSRVVASRIALATLVGAIFLPVGQAAAQEAPPPAARGGSPAKRFVDTVNEDLRRLTVRASTAEWIKNTYITDDSERLAAAANEELLGFMSQAVKKAARFAKAPTDPDTRRMLQLLRVSSSMAAPSDPKLRLELTTLAAKMEGIYGKAKACKPEA